MSTILATREFTTAVVAALATIGKQVGDGDAPTVTDLAAGYYVVYEVPGGQFTGPFFSDPDRDADLVYRVLSVGSSRAHCAWLADRARLTLLSRSGVGFTVAITPPVGWVITGRRPEGVPGGSPVNEGTRTTPVFNANESFVISVAQQ